MDDPLVVSGGERLGNLSGDGEGFRNRDRTARDAFGERRPVDELHDEGLGAVGLFEAVNQRDVGMVERGKHARLAPEPRQAIRIRLERGSQRLDRDVAPQIRVAGAIDLAHAAGPDGRHDLIRTKARTGGQSHFSPSG